MQFFVNLLFYLLVSIHLKSCLQDFTFSSLVLALLVNLESDPDHHGPPKVNCWQDPMNPSKWKEEHVSLKIPFFTNFLAIWNGHCAKVAHLI